MRVKTRTPRVCRIWPPSAGMRAAIDEKISSERVLSTADLYYIYMHERIGVFRIFGRNAGYTAWYAAYVTSSRCVIPEAPFDLDLFGTREVVRA